ncbi:MAG: hypothetical protein WCF65_09220, partial [Parachlamydiaceae bacterium]
IFVLTARFFLETIVAQGQPLAKRHAELILKDAVNEESFVVTLDQLNSNADVSKEVLTAMQPLVLKTADSFLPALVAEQIVAFSINQANSCQCRPWDEVIPLFSEGYAAARHANELLGQQYNREEVTQWLKAAVRAWKEALEKMHASASNKQPVPNQKMTEAAAKLKETKASANDVIRQIQEMELDDRSKINLKVQGSRGDDRPW